MRGCLAGIAAWTAVMLLAVPSLAGPPPAYHAPRDSHGHPDLEGTWTNESLTRLERRPELGDRLVLTPEETAALEFPGTQRKVMRVAGQPRSSFITSPANGRVPPLKPGGSPDPRLFTLGPDLAITDNPETQGIDDQCLLALGPTAGPVMLPLPNNSNYAIVQTVDTVAILVEMIHDVRIVRLNAQHSPVRVWYGDSIGHYEGDTLVVETTNYNPNGNIFGGSADMIVTERFTRVGPKRLRYEFKVVDPTVWASPWGGEYEFSPSKGPVYEYACHEGNYALPDILAGARHAEAEAAKAGAGASQQ
jgi:hypothetical protein